MTTQLREAGQTLLARDASTPPAGAAVFSAEIDARGEPVYRYRLSRTWQPGASRVLFIMLNPSIGTETVDDPTLRRCRGFAESWGYGGFDVVNLFALRSTDPSALYEHADPIGPENDAYVLAAHAQSAVTILAWGGTHGDLHGRGRAVAHLLHQTCKPVYALSLCSNGHPGHPLYLRADSQVQPFAFPAQDPLFVPLADAPWAAFNIGAKTVEVRQAAPRWRAQHVYAGRRVILRRGYATLDEISGTIARVYAGSVDATPAWVREGARIADWHASPYFNAQKPIVAFEVIRS